MEDLLRFKINFDYFDLKHFRLTVIHVFIRCEIQISRHHGSKIMWFCCFKLRIVFTNFSFTPQYSTMLTPL